jgi:hypothetical protein
MKPVFQKVHAETSEDFRLLARDWKITFSCVYEDPASLELDLDLPDAEPDEQYLAFNLAEHAEHGKHRLLSVSPLELRAGRPSPRPVPYWAAYIRGVGNFDKVYARDEARSLVFRTRAELKMIEKAFEKK